MLSNLKFIYKNISDHYYTYFPGYSILCQHWKILLYLLITLHSSLCYRNYLCDSGQTFEYSSLNGVIELGFSLFQSYDNSITLDWVRYYCELLYGSAIKNDEDKKILESMIDLYIKESKIITNQSGLPDYNNCILYTLPQKKVDINICILFYIIVLPKDILKILDKINEPLPLDNYLVNNEHVTQHYEIVKKEIKQYLTDILKIKTNI